MYPFSCKVTKPVLIILWLYLSVSKTERFFCEEEKEIILKMKFLHHEGGLQVAKPGLSSWCAFIVNLALNQEISRLLTDQNTLRYPH